MGIIAWIVLGLIVGAVAKMIMPGRDGGGIILTTVLGVVGAFVGGIIGKYVFQTALGTFADDFGTVDSAINDLPPGNEPYDGKGKPTNYCERQGRCNVGCLPGARHTLNKQLMAAALGKSDGTITYEQDNSVPPKPAAK